MTPVGKARAPLSALLRIPVHVLQEVLGPDGQSIHTSSPTPSAGNTNDNPSSTIVDWRCVLVIAMGCAHSVECLGKIASVNNRL